MESPRSSFLGHDWRGTGHSSFIVSKQAQESMSYEALIEHQGWVLSLARRLVRDAHSAEDLAQEVMVEALERPPSFGGQGGRPGRLRAWLGGIARHRAARSVERSRLRRMREEWAARSVADRSEATTAERLRLHRRLVEMVLKLEEPSRTTLVMHHFDGLDARQIAKELGVTPEVVRKRLSRGHVRVRRDLESEWGVSGEGLVCALAPLGIAVAAGSWSWIPGGNAAGAKSIAAAVGVVALGLGAWHLWPSDVSTPESPLGASDPSTLAEEIELLADLDPDVREERVAVEAPTDRSFAAAGFRGLVFDVRGAPVERAIAYLCADSELLVKLESDARGKVQWSGDSRPGLVILTAKGLAPCSFQIAAFRGEHELQFPEGDTFTCSVTLDGQLLIEPIGFWIRVLESPLAITDGIPEEVSRELGVHLGTLATRGFEVDDSNRYRLGAIPRGSSIRVHSPEGIWSMDELGEFATRDMEVAWEGVAQEDVELTLIRAPRFVARFVGDETGLPLGDLPITFHAEYDGEGEVPFEGSSSRWNLKTDSNGQVEWILGVAGPNERRQLRHDGAVPRVSRLRVSTIEVHDREIEIPEGGSRVDLGTIRVPHPRTVFLELVNSDGTPAVGARVFAEAAEASETSGFTRSGDEGVVTLRNVPEQAQRIWVVARGHRVVSLELSSLGADPNRPDRVQLEATNRLVIQLAPDSGAIGNLVKVNVVSEIPMFDLPEGLSRRLPIEILGGRGGHYDPGFTKERTHRYTFQTRESDRPEGEPIVFEMDGVVPGAGARIEVRNGVGAVLASTDVTMPPHGVTQEVVLRWTSSLRSVTGRVVDVEGEPVAGAQVILTAGNAGLFVFTGLDGDFSFRGIQGGETPLRVRVECSGYCHGHAVESDFTGDEWNVLVQLEPSSKFEISVVDADGQHVSISRPRPLGVEITEYQGRDAGTGRFTFDNLPLGPREFELRLGDREMRFVHRVGEGDFRLELPPLGAIRLAPPTHGVSGRDIRVRFTPVDAPAHSSSARWYGGERPVRVLHHRTPGRWRAQLVESREGGGPKRELGEPVEFDVVAGEVTVVALEVE